VPELQQMRARHSAPVLAFELENRAYFARFISDRGDAFFEDFTKGFADVLAAQQAGECAFYLLVDDDGSVIGRFNVFDLRDHAPHLGYRVAERVAGRGVATAAVEEMCHIAKGGFELRTLRAAVAHSNLASQRVLIKAGFVAIGDADPSQIGGKPGAWYGRDLEP
jgi:ribosomal-protein-alanine N-acetyltransferase